MFSLNQRVRVLEEQSFDSLLQTQNAITTDHKLRQRLETQDEGLRGLYMALCVDTLDPLKQGRIRIYSPLLSERKTPKDALPWASPISPFGGFDDSGSPWVPPAGSHVAIMFDSGYRGSPYYMGTIWDRNRGSDNSGTGADSGNSGSGHLDYWDHFPVEEYQCLWQGKRNGYNFGKNDGDEVLPPWNTESYNGYDNDSETTFYDDPEQFGSITYPYIYGMKTNEKHMLKFVDGDHKCNKRWKRLELKSSCNNMLIMKDDHLHPAGQWAFGEFPGSAFCHDSETDAPTENPCCEDDEQKLEACKDVKCKDPNEGSSESDCSFKKGKSNSKIDKDEKANPFYKRKEEQIFYDGVPTPMGNKCELPQSGIQLQSISGHQFVMDDSVDQPFGVPTWERKFDFGCNDVFRGKTFWRSTTGHLIELNDSEDFDRKLRGPENGILFKTANGNSIKMSDDTEKEGEECDCPSNFAGRERGITMRSTSGHIFTMNDEGVHQCAEARKDGGESKLENEHKYKGYILLRSGYGLQLLMQDKDIQTETNEQFIQLLAPQTDNTKRGPHELVMQEVKEGPGLIMLRAGGVYQLTTYDDSIEYVGVEDTNPSNKICTVTKNYIIDVKNYYFNHNDITMYWAEKYIFLLAGRDCPAPQAAEGGGPGQGDTLGSSARQFSNEQLSAITNDQQVPQDGPCIYNVVVASSPWKCPYTGFIHFGYMEDADGTTYDSRSPRVFAVGKGPATPSTPEQPTPTSSGSTGQPAGLIDDQTKPTSSFNTGGGNPGGQLGGEPPMIPDTIGQEPTLDAEQAAAEAADQVALAKEWNFQ
jgi:hypothetical protein